MKDPTLLEYFLLVTVCLLFAVVGLYMLANFRRLFRGRIKNEFLRRNAAAWCAIFFMYAAIFPMSGGFYILLAKYGWWGAIAVHFISTTVITLVSFNVIWAVAENKRLKRLSFVKHKLLLMVAIIFMTLVVNIPVTYISFDYSVQYLKYTLISSIYTGGVAGLVYAATSYLDLERKRKIDEKELELSRLRELKSKAELDALHSKVNPHFLYNALNSIADLSVTDGKKARQMTIALADLFRYSINYSNNNYSSVKDEVEMADVYLQIEKIRFEDKLNYTLDAENGVDNYLVPRFVLQPLVENAVKHGLKATGQMTEIRLEVFMMDASLVINVSDTGPSFPDDLNPGYGVKSVFDKMDLLFPGEYEILFANKPRKQVSIHIHKLMKNEPVV